MIRFKVWPSIRKSYEEQGAIFFACRTYAQQPLEIRDKIDRLCKEAGGAYQEVLREYLLTGASWQQVTMTYFLSGRTLQRCVQRFYMLW